MDNNPWTFTNWNVTAQGQYVLENGMEKAEARAAEAGTTVGGLRPPPPNGRPIHMTVIQKRVINRNPPGQKGFGPPG